MCTGSRVVPLCPTNKGPLAGWCLQGLLSFLESLYTFFPPSSREGTVLSDCTSELAIEPGAGSPFPQVNVQGSWSQSRGSPTTLGCHP